MPRPALRRRRWSRPAGPSGSSTPRKSCPYKKRSGAWRDGRISCSSRGSRARQGPGSGSSRAPGVAWRCTARAVTLECRPGSWPSQNSHRLRNSVWHSHGRCQLGHPDTEARMTTQTTAVITVKVLCFAQLRDYLGASDFTVSLPSDATGRELLGALRQRSQRIGPLLDVSRLAVNQEYVGADVRLQDGDDVVVIPPVSGG